MPPERLWQVAVVVEGAQIFHCPCRVAVGAVFQNIVEAVVEHDRIIYLAHRLADYARLAERNPIFQAAFNDQSFSRHFRYGVVVEHGRLYGVTYPAPMDRRHSVARFGNRTDIDKTGKILLFMLVYGADNISCRAVVYLHRPFRIVIGGGRHEGGNVQNDVAVLDALFYDFVIVQIAPNDSKPIRLHIWREDFPVLFGVAGENDDVLLVGIFEHLFERSKAHTARRARDKYALFFHFTHPSWRRYFLTFRRECRHTILPNRRLQTLYRRAERRAARSRVFYR